MKYILMLSLVFTTGYGVTAQQKISNDVVESAMLNATKYMVETVSTQGGYVWYYLPDLSRRWGEMEAYETMIWMQSPGSISMGHLFLDAYRATANEYYYQAAEKVANAIIWGQSSEGGWNYMVDFAGDRSLRKWYNTIGKNGWRLEEFQFYYGNSTFDDDVTSDAARFLLRMYLEKMDPTYKPALDKAIDFVLKSQYPTGGWPQRYPLRYDFNKQGFPDYTSYYTFNDDVIWENIHFLIQCYEVLGEARFLDPIQRGMNFYRISQDPSGGWGQQLNMEMRATSARTYEPAALLPGATYANAMLLIRFYQYTGDKEFLSGVPQAIEWLEKTQLPKKQAEGNRTHPTFIDIETQKPIYVHRKGSNVKYGRYYLDSNDKNLLAHYGGKTRIDIERLKDEYEKVKTIPASEVIKDSPLTPQQFQYQGTPQKYYNLNRGHSNREVDNVTIAEIINSLDEDYRWLTMHAYISNPYIGDGKLTDETDKYASTRVGDETDTSPYLNDTDQEYISTGEYIRNMTMLINYLQKDNQ